MRDPPVALVPPVAAAKHTATPHRLRRVMRLCRLSAAGLRCSRRRSHRHPPPSPGAEGSCTGRLCGKLRGLREVGVGHTRRGDPELESQCACRAVVGARAYGTSPTQHSGPAHRATGSAPEPPWRPTGGSGQCATFAQTTKNGECASRSGRGRGFGPLDHGERAGRARRARGWGGRRHQKWVVSVVTFAV